MNKAFMRRLVLVMILSFCHLAVAAFADQNSGLANRNFWLLNQSLTLYQNAAKYNVEELPSEPHLLKVGMKGNSILLLREHLRMTGDLAEENDQGGSHFDRDLAHAVKNFQDRHGLKADGVVGGDTRVQINVPPEIRLRQIAVNMQRWADLSNKLGNRFIIVNIPDFHMYLIENDKTVLMLRAIVGKPDLQTPELASKITRVVFNPYWNIPNKIAQNDIIPKMLQDPSYLYRMHIRAFRSQEDDSPELNPSRINWQAAANGFNYFLRQEPGADNALGLVKFEFQNSHDVYMHDTSAKTLFEKDIRDFSHGCIRLENPFALVEYLMKDDPHWNNDRIQRVLERGKTTYVKLSHPIPIFITYITAWVDQEGRVNFRDDLYQLDDDNAASKPT